MAKIRQSLWMFSGTVGDTVFCNGPKLGAYVRKRPTRKKNKKPTAKQLKTRLKMTKANHFLNTFRQVIGHCWKEQHGKMEPFYAATSQLIKYGIDVNGEEAQFIYEQVWLSQGKLERPVDPSFQFNNGEALIAWQTYGLSGRLLDDEAVVAFYNEDMEAGLVVRKKTTREDGILRETLPKGFLHGKIHAFLFFVSRDEKNASPTTYLGVAPNI